MSKAVLISIRPEWCEKIASGQKTIEIRKTRPKIDAPFKCYIYCTKDKPIMGRNLWLNDDGSVRYNAFEKCEEEDFDRYNQDHLFRANGMVIGEFVCDRIEYLDMDSVGLGFWVGNKFVYLKDMGWSADISREDVFRYTKGVRPYGWHISDLLIYDKPKELSEFAKPCYFNYDCGLCKAWDPWAQDCMKKHIKAPQSWCYVEELK